MDMMGIEVFLAIVRTKNLTKAAQSLHLSQSAVSYRLRMLEREMGAALVERRKGVQTISLTPFGVNFTAIAERWSIVAKELQVLRSLGPKVSLKIGAADSLNVYVLPPLYQIIRQHYPSINLKIITQHTIESYDSMVRKDIDIAFVKLEKVVPNVLVEPFYVDEMVLVRLQPEENLPDEVAPSELDSRNQIYLNWGQAYQMWHDKWWDIYNPPSLQVDAAALIFALMQDCKQWAIVPKSVANSLARSSQYKVQRLLDSPPPRVCYKLLSKHLDSDKKETVNMVDEIIKRLYPIG